MSESSLRENGYRMPAEWEPHESTWISWPHNEETWPSELERVEQIMARAVTVLSRSEPVRINVGSDAHRQRAVKALDAAGAVGDVRFHDIPTNDAWVRDYGPLFVVSKEKPMAATCWGFNSWGEKYPPFDLDDAASARMARDIGVLCVEVDMILEGGSIEVNGRGLVITTESCLLNSNRNPHLSRTDIEALLREHLGVREFVWLREGIAGDDTDGHIDDLTRFVAAQTVVTAVEEDPASPNYDVLMENLEVLKETETRAGQLEVIEIPMPEPVFVRGEQMPATYLNFYVGNRTVIVPTYGDPSDDKALGTLRRCFPTRDVVGIDCTDLIWGLGAFHCLTQQVPWGD